MGDFGAIYNETTPSTIKASKDGVCYRCGREKKEIEAILNKVLSNISSRMNRRQKVDPREEYKNRLKKFEEYIKKLKIDDFADDEVTIIGKKIYPKLIAYTGTGEGFSEGAQKLFFGTTFYEMDDSGDAAIHAKWIKTEQKMWNILEERQKKLPSGSLVWGKNPKPDRAGDGLSLEEIQQSITDIIPKRIEEEYKGKTENKKDSHEYLMAVEKRLKYLMKYMAYITYETALPVHWGDYIGDANHGSYKHDRDYGILKDHNFQIRLPVCIFCSQGEWFTDDYAELNKKLCSKDDCFVCRHL